MADQGNFIDLFAKDSALTPAERRRLQASHNRSKPRSRGYAAQPGSGPQGETCGSCEHLIRHRTARSFWKCDLVKWTHGPGTDIRRSTPACSRWEKPKVHEDLHRIDAAQAAAQAPEQ
jgi:hypothetical protein